MAEGIERTCYLQKTLFVLIREIRFSLLAEFTCKFYGSDLVHELQHIHSHVTILKTADDNLIEDDIRIEDES